METIVNKAVKSRKYTEVKVFSEPTLITGKERFDEWFSADGGIVWGSAIFLTGTSGAGKTTLMANLMKWTSKYISSMYSREMEGRSVKQQTRNLNIDHDNAYIADINDCANIDEYMEELDRLKPQIVIVDSLQVIAKEDFVMKGLSEDAGCYDIIKRLREWIAKNNAILFIIGHNRRDGEFAGKNTIVQMFDAHIHMVHNKKKNHRTIEWGQKNRKGPMGMMYYTFGESEIEFHTETEWEIIVRGKRDFLMTVSESIKGYIETIDKKHPDYKTIKKEYKAGMKEIVSEYNSGSLNDTGYVVKTMVLVDELSTKYAA